MFSKILKMHIDNFMTSVKHLKPLPLVTPEYYFPKIPQIFFFQSTIRQKTRSSAMNIAPWINYKWYDKWIDWWQMYRLYNWVDTRRNIFLLNVGALPRPLLAKFTSIYLNTSWFYSIYLNLSWFTSSHHSLPQFTHRWRCK